MVSSQVSTTRTRKVAQVSKKMRYCHVLVQLSENPVLKLKFITCSYKSTRGHERCHACDVRPEIGAPGKRA